MFYDNNNVGPKELGLCRGVGAKKRAGSRESFLEELDYMKMWVYSSHCYVPVLFFLENNVLPQFPLRAKVFGGRRENALITLWAEINLLVILLNPLNHSFSP